jgi:single-strand DNA-binding protein
MAGKSLNKAQIIGNLGRDPEVKFLPSGQAVANFTVATNEQWQDKDGAKQERTEWHKVVFFGKLAEIIGQYLSKGQKVFIEGRLQTRNYEKDGQKHYITEIVGRDLIMLGSRGEGGGGGGGSAGGGGGGNGGEVQPDPGYDGPQAPPDDIPF